jgi:hypothetical protein
LRISASIRPKRISKFGKQSKIMQNQNLKFRLLAACFLLLLVSCHKKGNNDPCNGVTITVTGTTTNSDGSNGTITASTTATSPTYSLNGGAYQASGSFTGLTPATYTVTAKNADGCTGSKSFVVAPSKTYLISQSTWRFSTATVSGIDISSSLPACQRDNILRFMTNGTGTIDEGATKCNAGDPQTSNFTWNFLTSETQIFISSALFTGGSNTSTLVTLSATQLVVSQVINGQTVVVTFIH